MKTKTKVAGAITIEDFKYAIKKAGSDGVQIIFPNGRVAFDALALDNFVLNHLGGWERVRAVIAFGSAVKKEVWLNARRGVFPIRWYAKTHVNKPNDFDFLIVLKEGSTPIEWGRKFDAIERVYVASGYSGWWDRRLKKGVLDIIEGTVSEFDAKHAGGDDVAEHILRLGVLVAGDFPHPLRQPEWDKHDNRCVIPAPR